MEGNLQRPSITVRCVTLKRKNYSFTSNLGVTLSGMWSPQFNILILKIKDSSAEGK